MNYQPTPEDRFTFGLWTVGWQGRDPFGDATRQALDPAESVRRLSELGAYGVTFHDDDLIPFGSSDTERESHIKRFRQALDATGMKVPMATTNLFTHPVFKDGAFTANDRDVRRYALRKTIRNIDLAVELGASVYVAWGGREGAESGAAKDVRDALDRMKEAFDLLGEYVTEQGYDLKFAIEPKPNEPRGDILLPTVGHALAFIERLERPELYGVNPEVGHEQMAGLNFPHGIAQALWAGKLFHIDLNGQSGIKYDQGPEVRRGRPAGRVLARRPAGAGRVRGSAALRLQAAADRGLRRRVGVGRGCMRNYLILKDRAAAFRADPQVQEALAAARLDELARPTAEDGLAALLADRSAYDTFDVDAAAARGMAFEHLDQLAMDHLLGAR